MRAAPFSKFGGGASYIPAPVLEYACQKPMSDAQQEKQVPREYFYRVPHLVLVEGAFKTTFYKIQVH